MNLERGFHGQKKNMKTTLERNLPASWYSQVRGWEGPQGSMGQMKLAFPAEGEEVAEANRNRIGVLSVLVPGVNLEEPGSTCTPQLLWRFGLAQGIWRSSQGLPQKQTDCFLKIGHLVS